MEQSLIAYLDRMQAAISDKIDLQSAIQNEKIELLSNKIDLQYAIQNNKIDLQNAKLNHLQGRIDWLMGLVGLVCTITSVLQVFNKS